MVMPACIADPSRALVIAGSPVSRIVLSRIARQACLKVHAVDPSEASQLLSTDAGETSPGLVIIDIDAQMLVSNDVFQHIETLRRASPRHLPRVLTIVPHRHEKRTDDGPVDAQVVRPVTPETLQPVIQRLLTGVLA
ncbi:response regulator [Nitratireductor sp. GISD-1A_MAKvit]|uniref:response regulator n=1 Tax=Nitratireductor sp. GISD-1A_MAKvit TaxID=3234198 RepID=UPI003465CCF6